MEEDLFIALFIETLNEYSPQKADEDSMTEIDNLLAVGVKYKCLSILN
jgi:hypothetical protein